MAGGIALGGLRPIVEIMFGDFIMLGADQILNHLVKYESMYGNKVSVPVTIRTTMGGRRGYGPTHSQSLEPLLASIPQLKIFSPTQYHDPGKLLRHVVLNESGIKIFCEYKMNYSREIMNKNNLKEGIGIKYSDGYPETVYLSNFDFEDPDILIISHGGNSILIEELMSELLMEYELKVQANLSSVVKPVNYADLFNGVDECTTIIILEESTKSFGWGAEIAASMTEMNLIKGKKVIRIGADEMPIPSSALLEKNVLPSKEAFLKNLESSGII